MNNRTSELISKLDETSSIILFAELGKYWRNSETELANKSARKVRAIYPDLEEIIRQASSNAELTRHFLSAIISTDYASNPRFNKYEKFINEWILLNSGPNAQSLSDSKIDIIGFWFFAIILAARIEQIGPVHFYQGVPDELTEVIKVIKSLDD